MLCKETCAALLSYINADSEKSKAAVTEGRLNFDEKFGGVNCRGRVPTRQAAVPSPLPRTPRHSPCLSGRGANSRKQRAKVFAWTGAARAET